MCGRYYVDLAILEQNIKEFDLDKNSFASGEVFPTNNVIVKSSNGYETIKWGIKPDWSKSLIINARSETIKDKPFFRYDFNNNRCVILATSYFEWNNKIKTEISTESPIIYFAGLYKIIDGQKEVVIITKEADTDISYIHNRMPLIINKDEIVAYLNDGTFNPSIVHDFKTQELR